MPHGEHRVQCIHCGAYYNCGDCITFTCRECDRKGHRGLSLDCPICSREAAERRARIDAAIAARQALTVAPEPGPEAPAARGPVKTETVSRAGVAGDNHERDSGAPAPQGV